MSWLNLKKFLPPKKLWKVLKSKLPLKLQKLSRSKAKINKTLAWPSSLSVQPKKFKKTKNPNNPRASIRHRSRNHKYQKPVFVDQLFLEQESVLTPGVAVKESKPLLVSDPKRGDRDTATADDMWEAMVIGSPHMHEIDERAEEFIARIKAEMRHQEMMARRL